MPKFDKYLNNTFCWNLVLLPMLHIAVWICLLSQNLYSIDVKLLWTPWLESHSVYIELNMPKGDTPWMTSLYFLNRTVHFNRKGREMMSCRTLGYQKQLQISEYVTLTNTIWALGTEKWGLTDWSSFAELSIHRAEACVWTCTSYQPHLWDISFLTSNVNVTFFRDHLSFPFS